MVKGIDSRIFIFGQCISHRCHKSYPIVLWNFLQSFVRMYSSVCFGINEVDSSICCCVSALSGYSPAISRSASKIIRIPTWLHPFPLKRPWWIFFAYKAGVVTVTLSPVRFLMKYVFMQVCVAFIDVPLSAISIRIVFYKDSLLHNIGCIRQGSRDCHGCPPVCAYIRLIILYGESFSGRSCHEGLCSGAKEYMVQVRGYLDDAISFFINREYIFVPQRLDSLGCLLRYTQRRGLMYLVRAPQYYVLSYSSPPMSVMHGRTKLTHHSAYAHNARHYKWTVVRCLPNTRPRYKAAGKCAVSPKKGSTTLRVILT